MDMLICDDTGVHFFKVYGRQMKYTALLDYNLLSFKSVVKYFLLKQLLLDTNPVL